MMTKIWMIMMRMTVGDEVDGVILMRRRMRKMRMTVPLRWMVSSMWPEGRMTSLGLTRSIMMPI